MSGVKFNENDFTILSALSLNYSSAYFVDFDKNEIYPYRISDVIEKQSGSYYRTNPSYWDAISSYIAMNTAPEDREDMLQAVSVESLERELSDKKLFTYDYRVFRDGETQYYRMKVANVTEGEGLHHAVVGFADISTQKIHDIERYAYVSDVTGGHNYNSFKEELNKCTEPGYLTAMDIYAFKIVNSTCGVKRGDETLRAAWKCLVKCLDPEDYAAHINADHFVIFFRNMDKELLDGKLVKITEALEQMSKDIEVPLLSPYFGSAEWNPGDSVEQIYGNATFAKHSIKGVSGRNHAYYSKADSEKVLQEKQMTDAFESAIENREFELWYQPKYTPEGKVLIGAEALVRWRRDGKMISPGAFIPVFEKNGMIKRLDEYVFRTVCKQQRKWMDEGRRIIPISVNISRVSLYFQNVVEQYSSILEETGVQSVNVPLEITESAAVDNADIKSLTDRFFRCGFALHMDDFGTGYSSLSSLNQMHFNTLKLDKSIIDYIGNYGGDKLLEHTIALAKDLGLHVTAEGVETESQVNFLKWLRCDSIQGYFFSKPLPVPEFEVKLSESGNGNDEQAGIISEALPISRSVKAAEEKSAEYAKQCGKSFICNSFMSEKIVHHSSEILVSVLSDISRFVTDSAPKTESIVFLCSDISNDDRISSDFKFVIIGLGANISASKLESRLSDDPSVSDAIKNINRMGGSVSAALQDDKDLVFIIRLNFRNSR